jgi:heme oxygenase
VRQLSKTLLRLNVETRAFHADADAPWLDLVAPTAAPTRLDYIDHLAERYGFDASVESALAYTPHLSSVVDLHPRHRAGYIAEDLLRLGMSPAEIADLPQAMVAPFASVGEALGWLYVHERSTLLHDTACTRLLERMPELAYATSYLRRNEGQIGVLWDDLGQALDNVAGTIEIEDRIVTAAIEGSRLAIHWYRYGARDHQRQAVSS